MNLTISSGSASDLPVIMPVMKSAFDPRFGEAWTQTQCAGALSLGGTSMWVARTDDVVGGFAVVRRVLDEAELLLIAIDLAHQRNGIGKSLLNHIVAILSNARVSSLHVEVRHDNPALRFYNDFGFKQVGERRDYYRRMDGVSGTAFTLVMKIAQNNKI